jgi:hypothetical protein
MRGFDCEWTIGHLVKGRHKRVRVGTDPLTSHCFFQDIKADVASYVARLPMPATNVTEWTKTLDADPVSPMLAHDQDHGAKPLDYKDK